MEFSVDVNLPDLSRWIGDIAARQLPYATAVALTRTAADAQAFVRRGLPGAFHLRRSWVLLGVRIVAARKSDGLARMQSVVGHRDEEMVRHVTGEDKRPRGQYLAVPIYDDISRVKAGHKPVPARGKRKPFRIRFRSGHEGVARRVGRPRLPIELLRSFESLARIDERWDFPGEVAHVARARLLPHWRRAMEEAIRTSR